MTFIDPLGLDAIILLNPDSGGSQIPNTNIKHDFGHMAIIVQDENGKWYYFSSGKGYVKFDMVDEEYMTDLKTFSENYYWKDMYYTESVYIKGNFSESFHYYQDYFVKNNPDNNASYDIMTNNCGTAVMEGFMLGKFWDGASIEKYVDARMTDLVVFILMPTLKL